MLHRDAQPTFIKWIRKGATVLFVAEAASFGVSYLVWYRMNTNRGRCTTHAYKHTHKPLVVS